MKKKQLQIIDSSLFFYGALVTFFLLASSLFHLDSPGNITLFTIFLPVAVYFGLKIFNLFKNSLHRLLNLDGEKHSYFGGFSLSAFINQTEPTFLINLVLLCFAVALILFRISMQNLK